MLYFIKETDSRVNPSGGRRKMGLYKCSCGNEKEICISLVRRGKTVSCGCANIKQITTLGKIKGENRWNRKHGMYNTRFYNIYYGAMNRCSNRNDRNYRFYGSKGIKVLWKSFDEFKNDMLESYDQHCKEHGIKQTTLDRIDSKKHYCKENCRWATYKEQAREKIGMVELVKNLGIYNKSNII